MRYIIYCGPGIGDFILILPMVRAIKECDSKAYIKAVMTSTKGRFAITEALFSMQNYIDEIDYYNFTEKKKAMLFLIKNGIKSYDEGFVLQYTSDENTSVWPCRLVRIASKKMYGIETKKRGIKYDLAVKREEGCSILGYMEKLLIMSGKNINFDRTMPLLNPKEFMTSMPEWYKGKRKKMLVVLCLGTAKVSRNVNGTLCEANSKMWSYVNWILLASHMCRLGYEVFLMGGRKEKEDLDKLNLEFDREEVVDGVGRCDIIESLAVISNSELVIGCDTGIMHCAGALGIPTLTLFGCTDWREYLPYGNQSHYIQSDMECSPCFGTDNSVLCPYDYECMDRIKPEYVVEQAKKILGNNQEVGY